MTSGYFLLHIKNCNVNINGTIFSKVNYFLSHRYYAMLPTGRRTTKMSVSRHSDIKLGHDRMNQLILTLGCYFAQ